MSGTYIDVRVEGFDVVARNLDRLNHLNRALVLDAMGALIESQTRRRLSEEKSAPDGPAWKPNAEGTSILVRQGHLLASIHSRASGSEVRVGSGLVYSAIHQFGGTIEPKDADALHFEIGGRHVAAKRVTIPARPYLGFSAENKAEIKRELTTYIGSLLRG
jgi:phage virion morphogenesis protein